MSNSIVAITGSGYVNKRYKARFFYTSVSANMATVHFFDFREREKAYSKKLMEIEEDIVAMNWAEFIHKIQSIQLILEGANQRLTLIFQTDYSNGFINDSVRTDIAEVINVCEKCNRLAPLANRLYRKDLVTLTDLKTRYITSLKAYFVFINYALKRIENEEGVVVTTSESMHDTFFLGYDPFNRWFTRRQNSGHL